MKRASATILLLLAHSWYPSECCGDGDCHPVPCAQLRTVQREPKPSQDGQCHICIHRGNILCIFVPQVSS